MRIKKTIRHQVILALIAAKPAPPPFPVALPLRPSAVDRTGVALSPPLVYRGEDSEQCIWLGLKLHVSSSCACCSVEVFVEGFRVKFHGKCCSDKVLRPPMWVDPERCERLESPFDLHIEPKV